jgi:hypothetical protein
MISLLLSLNTELIYCQELCCRTPLVESIVRTFTGHWKLKIRSRSLIQKFELLNGTHSPNESVKDMSIAYRMPKYLQHKLQKYLWDQMINQISAPMLRMNVDSDTVNISTESDALEPMQMLFESHNKYFEGQVNMDNAITEDLFADSNMAIDDNGGVLFDEEDSDHDINKDDLLMDLNGGECDARNSDNLVIDDGELMIW